MSTLQPPAIDQTNLQVFTAKMIGDMGAHDERYARADRRQARSLAEDGPATPQELAARTETVNLVLEARP
jgi:hypothetical protein